MAAAITFAKDKTKIKDTSATIGVKVSGMSTPTVGGVVPDSYRAGGHSPYGFPYDHQGYKQDWMEVIEGKARYVYYITYRYGWTQANTQKIYSAYTYRWNNDSTKTGTQQTISYSNLTPGATITKTVSVAVIATQQPQKLVNLGYTLYADYYYSDTELDASFTYATILGNCTRYDAHLGNGEKYSTITDWGSWQNNGSSTPSTYSSYSDSVTFYTRSSSGYDFKADTTKQIKDVLSKSNVDAWCTICQAYRRWSAQTGDFTIPDSCKPAAYATLNYRITADWYKACYEARYGTDYTGSMEKDKTIITAALINKLNISYPS